MDKRRYYVSVQARSVMHNQGDAAYELEINATTEEVEKLMELFNEWEEFDEQTFFRAQIPTIPYHHDSENDGYDYFLKDIYKAIYQMGTDETKSHISSMNLQMGSVHE
ncbi:hypothetical protein Back11_14510 [Paenibacillus baekrokdamisoli]|uniref:Uncharacterized protein n=1 Tax=Paenibacillus baekrokdamisoli TaxID=1712516 RepID=A0A3G9IP27_9BACL|nr:hypothetical protein [Paenibacillus baekrokdamisoli]MBB3070756.1 hypothetical protein [Paenibacillus baekrokdamisoli]BBH20106.1 hypothetical protein Back11_14510 [Paenibacillus baekrokdamisoli]